MGMGGMGMMGMNPMMVSQHQYACRDSFDDPGIHFFHYDPLSQLSSCLVLLSVWNFDDTSRLHSEILE